MMTERDSQAELRRFVDMVIKDRKPIEVFKALRKWQNEDDLNGLLMAAFNFGKKREITKSGDEEERRAVIEIILPFIRDEVSGCVMR